MKKILRNGMLIIIAICITTYLVIGVTSIYRSNINKHNNLLNNVDDKLVYDNKLFRVRSGNSRGNLSFGTFLFIWT